MEIERQRQRWKDRERVEERQSNRKRETKRQTERDRDRVKIGGEAKILVSRADDGQKAGEHGI